MNIWLKKSMGVRKLFLLLKISINDLKISLSPRLHYSLNLFFFLFDYYLFFQGHLLFLCGPHIVDDRR